jgi:dipeptidyl aminopeptidase/acylaminoacyl peptidase
LKPDFEALQQVRDGDFSVVSRDLADRTWVVAYVVDDGPVYYYLYDRGDRCAELLFSNRSDLERYTLAKMRPISFTARDGLTIHGYLTLPVGVPPQAPAHGPECSWRTVGRDTWGLDPETQWLANRGYAVLQVNFRGPPVTERSF